MARAKLGLLPGCREPLPAVFADRLQEPVAPHSPSGLPDHQRLIDQPRQQIEHFRILDFGFWLLDWVLVRRQTKIRTDLLGGLQIPAAGKHGQARQEGLLRRREQLVAPIDSVPDGLLMRAQR